jgi:hypothetical protein
MIDNWLAKTITMVAGLAVLAVPGVARAGGVVGTGTSTSCTEAALNASLAGGGTVTFDCGGGPVTITLTGTKTINVSTTIDGSGEQITLSGGNTVRMFVVPWQNTQAVTLRLRFLTLHGARTAEQFGGAIKLDYQDTARWTTLEAEDCNFLENVATQTGNDVGGGAIHSVGNRMTIRRCLFRGNSGGNGGAIGMIGAQFTIEDTRFESNSTHAHVGDGGNGGAIYIDGSSLGLLTLRRVTFSSNTASNLGGAIHTWMYGLPSAMTIEDSVFASNSAGGNGGAIFHMNGQLDIVRTAFHDNSAWAQGGGLWVLADGGAPNDTPVTVTNATFYRNQAAGCSTDDDCWAVGGGIANSGASSLTLSHVTLVENHAGWTGGGIASSASNVSVRASIIANNSAANPWNIARNCTNTLPDAGFSLEWPAPATSNWNDYPCGFTLLNPTLGSLVDAGTAGATLPPLPGSPAIDRVTSGCPSPLTDQRGTARPQGTACDTGAHEVPVATDVWVDLAYAGGNAAQGQAFVYTAWVGNVGPLTDAGVAFQVVFPTEAGTPAWTCTATGGGSCPAAGAGDVDTTVNLPVGAVATFTATGSWGSLGTARQLLASASATPSLEEAQPSDNSAVVATQVQRRAGFVPLTPCRLIDTRNAGGANGGPILGAATARTFVITGATGGCGIPTTAWAVSVNATVVGAAGTGYLSLFAGGTPVPGTSSVSFAAGRARANNAIVALSAGGAITALASQSTHFILDVNGYFE